MATNKTRRELVERALSNLGMLVTGQSPGYEEAAHVDAEIDPLLDRLQAKGVAYVPDPDSIEPALFQPLANLLAEECAEWSGRKRDPQAVLLAEMELRLVNRGEALSVPMTAEYF